MERVLRNLDSALFACMVAISSSENPAAAKDADHVGGNPTKLRSRQNVSTEEVGERLDSLPQLFTLQEMQGV